LKPWSQAPRTPPIFTQAMQIASSSREPSMPPMSTTSDQPKSASKSVTVRLASASSPAMSIVG
jgi:hypothetical protein